MDAPRQIWLGATPWPCPPKSLGPFKSIKVVDPSVIYLKDGSGATLVELDVELKVD